jgi:hypothetical protein
MGVTVTQVVTLNGNANKNTQYVTALLQLYQGNHHGSPSSNHSYPIMRQSDPADPPFHHQTPPALSVH